MPGAHKIEHAGRGRSSGRKTKPAEADTHQDAAHRHKKHQDELLDEGLEESFPASDPVSVKHIS